MTHEISDALTGTEARAGMARLLRAVEAHDESRDDAALHADILAIVRQAEADALGVPDDSGWRNEGHVAMPGERA